MGQVDVHVYLGYFAVSFLMALCFKWRTPYKELITENTKTPKINFLIMSFTLDHLWRKIIKGAAQRGPPDK